MGIAAISAFSAFFDARGYDFPTAARAIRALVANPDDLPQVFTIIGALSGRTPEHLLRRLRSTAEGRALIVRGNDLARHLADRDALRALPDGSLGRAYLAFVESEGISAEGILEASERGRLEPEFTPEVEFIHGRLRDTHDLWHAVTGYKGDILGELALLAFSAAQTRNPAIVAIVVVALAKGFAHGHLGLVVDGFRRGRASAWLVDKPWEELLARPLEDVRRELAIEPPPVYTPRRTEALRKAGLVPSAA